MRKCYSVFLIFCICITLFTVSCGKRYDFHIFEDISECEAIENSTLSGAKFEHYNVTNDKELKGLTYNERFCGKFSCDDFEFEIFAYEFVNSDTAKQYFVNVTGMSDRTEADTNFLGSWGMFSGQIIVFDFERVYRVELSNGDTEEVFAFLSTVFSKKVATA